MKLIEEVEHCKKVHADSHQSILNILRKDNFDIGVEIGVQYAINAKNILANNLAKSLYGIDPYNSKHQAISPLKDQDEEIYQYAMEQMQPYGVRYFHIRKTSNEALFNIRGTIDFVYIDGNNSKQYYTDDLYYWYPKVKKNGVVIGHNYNHPSFVHNVRIVNDYFGGVPHTEEGYIWWMRTGGLFNLDRKISVAIPHFNSSKLAEANLEVIKDDKRIDQIVISDDCSSDIEYSRLKQVVSKYPKVQLYRNSENVGEFKNRINAATKCKNHWVILLDCDNTLSTEYIDALYRIPQWKHGVIYAPDFGNPKGVNYKKMSGDYINLASVKNYFNREELMIKMFLNTGNYFINRREYLKVAEPIQNKIEKYAYGDIFFNYHWLKNGGLMFVVPEMFYTHRFRQNSSYKTHFVEMQPVIQKICSNLQAS
jgi:GT2 family glycosyltransferase